MEDVNRLSPFLYYKGTNNICNTKQNVSLFLRKHSIFAFINTLYNILIISILYNNKGINIKHLRCKEIFIDANI